jgi:hypothetical protein
MPVPDGFCPYVGLQPYTEADRDYFFGRERDQRIIASNLYAAPLTILYGASGVGKSSVLLAGVVPDLSSAPRTAVVVFREWQGVLFLDGLKSRCLESVAAARQKPLAHGEIDATLPFDDFLHAAGQAFGGSILILFDQFEEYFLYHPESETGNTFDSQFARAINRDEVDVGFLIALREDALSKLDRFRVRIPNLLGNTLRLQHMDAVAAEDAIRKPLEVYNSRFSTSNTPITIEDELVWAIRDQVRIGQVQLGQAAGAGQAQTRDDTARIEAPFLQLVITRLWDEEVQANSRTLRLSTLERLGDAQEIVRTYLDGVMNRLDGAKQEVCSRFFDRLVTPSGNKIACSVDDLTKWAGTMAVDVPSVLQDLSGSRILRRVAAPTGLNGGNYEIFHDVLAPAILGWRAQYIQTQQQAEAEIWAKEQQQRAEEQARAEEQGRVARRLRLLLWTLSIVSMLAVVFAVTAVQQARRAQQQARDAEAFRAVAEDALAAAKKAEQVRLAEIARQTEALQGMNADQLRAVNEAALAAANLAAKAATELLVKAQTEFAAAQRVRGTAAPSAAPPTKTAPPAQEAPPLVATGPPARIYLHIQDEEQRTRAQQIEKALEAQKFDVPGIERLKTGPTTGAEVRFFRKGEQEGANQIVDILRDLNVQGVQAQYIPGFEQSTKIRSKHYEIWFASDAFK